MEASSYNSINLPEPRSVVPAVSQQQAPKTWADMKAFVNRLTDEQLSMQLKWWGEEKAGVVTGLSVLPEDYVQVEEYCEPASTLELEEGETMEDYPVCYPKGQPIIDVD